ncbi:MAG: hypothetical protein B6240_11115 [Desulfobacteraceae bacterium 4572_87]|nr:MAG: hypothetical protein B6240_11115 [Desulfobacteraceae bacterium 4572_87]
MIYLVARVLKYRKALIPTPSFHDYERVISRMKHAKEPWAINGIADRVASLLSNCGSYDEESRSAHNREKERVFRALKEMDGILPFPPTVNYILCQWRKTDNLDDLLTHLLEKGLYLRDCRNFPGLENNFFRVGLRIPRENDLLLARLNVPLRFCQALRQDGV